MAVETAKTFTGRKHNHAPPWGRLSQSLIDGLILRSARQGGATMPLDRLLLLLAVVIAAAGLTVWLGTVLAVSSSLHPLAALMPAGFVVLGLSVLWRVVAGRL